MPWCVDIDLKSAPVKCEAMATDPGGLMNTKLAAAILAVVAVSVAIVAAQTQGNDVYSKGLMDISGGLLLLGFARCTLSRRFVSLLADFSLLGVVLFDFVGDLFVDTDSLMALSSQDAWLQQTLRVCWVLGGVMYALHSIGECDSDGKRRPLSPASKAALCMAIEVLADGSVIYSRVGDIFVPLRLNVLNASVPFASGFALARWAELSGAATAARGPCAPPPPTPPCAPPGDKCVEAELADDTSMGEASDVEIDEPTGSPQPSPRPSPTTSKCLLASPDTVISGCLGQTCGAPPQALWGGSSRAQRSRRAKKTGDVEGRVRAAAQVVELGPERTFAVGGKPPWPRSGTERSLHCVMKATRTRRPSPLEPSSSQVQVRQADWSRTRELDCWHSQTVAPGCGVDSLSKETSAPARVATAQIEVEDAIDVEEISTSSMLPEKLFQCLI